jgi:hypothetical protein
MRRKHACWSEGNYCPESDWCYRLGSSYAAPTINLILLGTRAVVGCGAAPLSPAQPRQPLAQSVDPRRAPWGWRAPPFAPRGLS